MEGMAKNMNKNEVLLNKEISGESLKEIKKSLEAKQNESQDEFFKKLDLGKLKPEALMVLNAAIEESQTPFPKEIKKKAVAMASESAFYPEDFSSPKERLDYIKDIIIRYPNAFYTEGKEF